MTVKHRIDISSAWTQFKNLISDYDTDEMIPEDEELKLVFNKLIAKLSSYSFIPEHMFDSIENSYTDEIGLDLNEFNYAWGELTDYCKADNIQIKY